MVFVGERGDRGSCQLGLDRVVFACVCVEGGGGVEGMERGVWRWDGSDCVEER